jgi:tetratricopeptide (TPR) repeat protein
MQLGWSHGQNRAFTEGKAEYDEAAAILEKIAAGDPANMAAQYHLTAAYRGRGIVCEYAGDVPCAIADFERAAAIHQTLSEKDPSSAVYPGLRGELMARTGRLYLQQHKGGEARTAMAEGIRILASVADRPTAGAPQLVEACKAIVLSPIPELRDLPRADAYCRKAVDLTAGKDSYALEVYADVRGEMGDNAGAIAAINQALALLPQPKPGEPVSKRREALLEALAKYQKINL